MVAEASFSNLINRLFAELLTEGRFALVATKDDPSNSYSVATYASDHSLLNFSQHRDEWQMEFAPLPVQNQKPKWVSAGLLYNYLTKAPVDMEEAFQDIPSQSLQEGLSEWAGLFRPVNRKAIAFFDPQGFEDRLRDFESFQKQQNEEVRRQLEDRRARRGTA